MDFKPLPPRREVIPTRHFLLKMPMQMIFIDTNNRVFNYCSKSKQFIYQYSCFLEKK